MTTPAQRREIARAAANERWSRPGAREAQSRAQRAAMHRRLVAQVDPDGLMSEDELAVAVAHAAKAEAARMRAAKASG